MSKASFLESASTPGTARSTETSIPIRVPPDGKGRPRPQARHGAVGGRVRAGHVPAVGGVEDGAEVVREDHGSKDGRRADDVELRAEEDRIEGKAAPRDFGLGRNDARHGDGRAARGRPSGAAGGGGKGRRRNDE